MLLTRNGRFYHDAVYMEKATAKSGDVSDTTVLLHAIRQAFSKLGIDQKQLDEMVNKIDPTIMHQQSVLPPKEDWKQFVGSLSGKAPFYVSIEPKGNRLFAITPSKTKTKFIAPNGLGDRAKIYIEPSNTPQQAASANNIGIFDFTGAGTKGTTFISIIPAQFKKTNTNGLYIEDTTGVIETSDGQQATPQSADPVDDQSKPKSTDANPSIQDQEVANSGQNLQGAIDELAKLTQTKLTKTIQGIQRLNLEPMGIDNMLVASTRTVDINNDQCTISVYYPNFEQIDKLINLQMYYPEEFNIPEDLLNLNLKDLIKSGKIKSVSPFIMIRYKYKSNAAVVKGAFNT